VHEISKRRLTWEPAARIRGGGGRPTAATGKGRQPEERGQHHSGTEQQHGHALRPHGHTAPRHLLQIPPLPTLPLLFPPSAMAADGCCCCPLPSSFPIPHALMHRHAPPLPPTRLNWLGRCRCCLHTGWWWCCEEQGRVLPWRGDE
jgi:hypothetical protein